MWLHSMMINYLVNYFQLNMCVCVGVGVRVCVQPNLIGFVRVDVVFLFLAYNVHTSC